MLTQRTNKVIYCLIIALLILCILVCACRACEE